MVVVVYDDGGCRLLRLFRPIVKHTHTLHADIAPYTCNTHEGLAPGTQPRSQSVPPKRVQFSLLLSELGFACEEVLLC